jgi:hypothetical protein
MLGYEFLRKTPELFEQRRVGLDRYANLAQISQLLLHLTVGILALLASNQIKRSSRNGPPATMLAFNARRLQTALGTEAAEGYGTYGQWTFGIAYTAWLGYLCIAETAPGKQKHISLPDCRTDTYQCRLLAPHQKIRTYRSLATPDPLPTLRDTPAQTVI